MELGVILLAGEGGNGSVGLDEKRKVMLVPYVKLFVHSLFNKLNYPTS